MPGETSLGAALLARLKNDTGSKLFIKLWTERGHRFDGNYYYPDNNHTSLTDRMTLEQAVAYLIKEDTDALDSKPDRTELSNVLAEPVNDTEFAGLTVYTKEDLIDEALIAQCKAVDPNIEWNSTTHRFKYNGLEDLTVDEMRKILFYSVPITSSCVSLYSAKYPPCRTLVPTMCGSDVWEANAMFQMCSDLVTIKLSGKNGQMAVKTLRNMFGGCYRLKEVYGVLKVNMVKSFAQFAWYCDALEGVYLSGVSVNLDMGELPKWRLDCIEYLITNAANTAPITITLHPDAYARVTDEIIALAASKNITIASA